MFETYILPIIIFAVMGLAAGLLLTIVSKVFEVKTDERVEKIAEVLPQANCGACGYSGCSGYAEAVASGKAELNLCRPGGAEAAGKIAEIMGQSAGEFVPKCAVVHCRGDCTSSYLRFTYTGSQSCAAANRFYQGSKSCTHGCLGFGDCAKACPEGAITITDAVASVDRAKCVACGICTNVCPNRLISIVNMANHINVLCSSTDPGKITRTVCKKGCIGCKLCEKKCRFGAVRVVENHAVIDPELCTSCGECAAVCPTGAIQSCDATWVKPEKPAPKPKPAAPKAAENA